MHRRDFLKLGSATAAGAFGAKLLTAQSAAQTPSMPQMPAAPAQASANAGPEGAADFTLTIAPVLVELAPRRALSTIGYNGSSPGPLLKMREGKKITVDVIND